MPSHSSAISSYVFNVAPEILGMQGPVVFVDIRYGSVGLQNRKHSSYGYCRYARRTGTPGAAQGIDFIQLLPDCIIDDCDDVFNFIAYRIGGFHNIIIYCGCKLRIFL